MKRYIILLALCALCAGASAQDTIESTPATTDSIAEAVVVQDTLAEAVVVQDTVATAGESQSWVGRVSDWYKDHMNYGSITALMTIESSFIPFPSEVVVPPAAYVAADETSPLHSTDSYPLNVALVVLFASLGAMIGAIINYGLSIWLGRPVIYKFADSKIGHLCLLSGEKLQKAEEYFRAHGKVSTFVGRLVPGIRQLISIPAGLARMNFGIFMLYTFLGATIWNTVLALLGYLLAGQSELITQYSHEIGYVILAVVALAIVYLVARRIWRARKQK